LGLAFTAELARAQETSSIVGNWLGELKAQSQSLRIVFTITEKDGKLKATMDSPDQGAKGIPTSSVTLGGNAITIEAKLLGAAYRGELSSDGATVKGTWSQSGKALPPVAAPSRPQEPKPPFPYKDEEVTVEGKKVGVRLAGTLVVPASPGPFPAVVFVTGSGPQNRDEEILGHKPSSCSRTISRGGES
jgi:hypothetical protein